MQIVQIKNVHTKDLPVFWIKYFEKETNIRTNKQTKKRLKKE